MQDIKLSNELLEIGIHFHGAELSFIRRKDTGTDFLWNADARFWGRSSPVLFPFVGSVKDKKYRCQGKEYSMNQHGFARDKDFSLVSQSEDMVWFGLNSDEDTYRMYPFKFYLEIGYKLNANTVTVMWKVKNTDDKDMYFSIGAHPAFLCPLHEGEKQSSCYLSLRGKDGTVPGEFVNTVFGQGGLVTDEKKSYLLENGLLPVREDLFDGDALVIEDHQIQRVALLNSDKKEYLAVEFDAPLVGIWSPPKKKAPFVCIEPWYGRCDSETFDGELKDRKWGNILAPGQIFEAEYRINIPICVTEDDYSGLAYKKEEDKA